MDNLIQIILIAVLYGRSRITSATRAGMKMGAGAGYSVVNGLAITLLCLLGLAGFVSALIPVEAGAAILLWIGVIIASQAFQATPRDHAPAVVIGFFPAPAAWGLLPLLEDALGAAGTDIQAVGLKSLAMQLPIAGMISLERGFIFTSVILAAMTVCLIERKYRAAAVWAGGRASGGWRTRPPDPAWLARFTGSPARR